MVERGGAGGASAPGGGGAAPGPGILGNVPAGGRGSVDGAVAGVAPVSVSEAMVGTGKAIVVLRLFFSSVTSRLFTETSTQP